MWTVDSIRSASVKLVWVYCLLALFGCGYTFQGSGSVLPPDIKKIYVPLAVNNTTEPGLSIVVTEALRDRFERFGVFYVVESHQEADAVLNAIIKNVRRETRTTTSRTDTAVQYDSQLVLAADLRRVSGPVLWRNQEIAASRSFGTDSSVIVTSSADFADSSIDAVDLGNLDSREISRGQEAEVLEELAEQAARIVYQQAVTPEF